MKNRLLLTALLCTSLLVIANSNAKDIPLTYDVIAERAHDATLFTQGILIDGAKFYESAGLYGKSRLVSYYIAPPSPSWQTIALPFVQQQSIDDQYFSEGLALLNNQLYMLTWQEKAVLVFDKATFSLQKTLHYEGEGWGLTSDGKALIRSDGSDQLFFHDPKEFKLQKTLKIKDDIKTINNINELEYAQGFIWANIWYADDIIKIDPTTGNIVGRINLAELKKSVHLSSREYVLNGIAWDEKQKAFWVTGKNWPKMFLIKIHE